MPAGGKFLKEGFKGLISKMVGAVDRNQQMARKGAGAAAAWFQRSQTKKARAIRFMGEAIGSSAEAATKGMVMASFAPLAAVGYPVVKLGTMGAKGGWSIAKGIGGATWKTGFNALSTPGKRTVLAGSLATLGTAMATQGQLHNEAERVRNRHRDPANSMGLSQSLHYAHRR